MRFRNLSSIVIDTNFWRELAFALGVGHKLPLALADDLGLYISLTLRVTIRPKLLRSVNHETASYTCGHISLYPCSHCTAASLTWAYLHELLHVWIEQNFEPFYLSWDSCPLADAFADGAFHLFGGILPTDSAKCSEYDIDICSAYPLIPKFHKYVAMLVDKNFDEIKRWQELDILTFGDGLSLLT